ncbi:MAG TPA: DUF1800 domain-containing protein [Tepidisphaeraceae bacterium]|jgi:uncharacterized protein (DUF1800 family)
MNAHWEPYISTDAAPWDIRRVVHLHRCAAFGATWSELQRDLHDGPEASVSRLLTGSAHADGLRPNFEALSTQVADAAVISNDAERLKAWWLLRMFFSPDPLAERLALMWHNHFATSNFKVKDLAAMRRQNDTFRKLGRSHFAELFDAMLHDAALLVWLDSPSNRKGQPNENLARESMELFTLGVGNFTEDDVKQAARALTGQSVADGEFRLRPQWHDDADKTILGQTAPFDARSLARLLLAQPPTARRLAWRLCLTFLGENVASEQDLADIAQGLRDHDLDIAWAVQTILRSQLFFSEPNLNAHVTGPVEFVIGAACALELFDPPPSTLVLAEWVRRLGQDLFTPPNVGGWNEGRSWLTTRTVLARANYAAALVHGELSLSSSVPDLAALARRAGSADTLPDSIQFFSDLLLGRRLPPEELQKITAHAGNSLPDSIAMLLATPQAQLA